MGDMDDGFEDDGYVFGSGDFAYRSGPNGWIKVKNNGDISVKADKVTLDGYSLAVSNDGYSSKNDQQLNIKITKEDLSDLEQINKHFFENEAPNSMLGRIILRKGIQFYKNLLVGPIVKN